MNNTRSSLMLSISVVAGCSVTIGGGPTDGGVDPTSDGGTALEGSVSDGAQADASGLPDSASLDDGSSGNGNGGGSPAALAFGITVNRTSDYPSLHYGTQRIWDSPPFQWATLQTGPCADVTTCSGGFDATNLTRFDGYLAQLKTNGVEEVWYTMARTPNFASSAPNDANCNYAGAGQGGLGQCDRPSDLAADGTGTNLTFRKWYAFFALRSNDKAYLQTHAHIRYWEPWNEPDTAKFWGDGAGGPGGYDPLIRLMQDAECLIVGTVGTGKITKTGETCAQVQASVGLGKPIDPTAIVVSPSYHAKAASLSLYQNFLYCNNAPRTSCTSGDAGAKSMMAFNLHMKPGAECVASGGTNCTAASSVEPAYASYVKGFEGILQPAELAAFQGGSLPLLDGEASYSPTGFVGPFTDHDMAASWIPRFFLIGRSLGVTGNQWYTWDSISGNTKVITAWNTLFDTLSGGVVSKPVCTNAGSVYTCTFTKGAVAYEVLWDIGQDCSAGVCSTTPQHVAGTWKSYLDLTGTAATCTTACAIAGGSVPIGIKPVLLTE